MTRRKENLIKVITWIIIKLIFGSGIKLYNYLLIEIAIFIIVFAHTKGIFLDIIIMSKGKQQKGQTTWQRLKQFTSNALKKM